MSRPKLDTIFSIGEGRTFVYATDGCKACINEFMKMAESVEATPTQGSSLREGKSPKMTSPPASTSDSKQKFVEKFPFTGGAKVFKLPFGNSESKQDTFSPAISDDVKLKGGIFPDAPTKAVVFESGKRAASLRSSIERSDDESGMDEEADKEEEEEEEGAALCEVSLRTSDRLVVAFYSLPPPLSLKSFSHHSDEHTGNSVSRSASTRSDGADLTSPREKPKGGLAGWLPPAVTNGLPWGKHHGAEEKSEEPAGLPASGRGSSLSVSETTVIMPMVPWSQVEETLKAWDGSKFKDSLLKMAHCARPRKFRFEAFRLEPSTNKRSPKDTSGKLPGVFGNILVKSDGPPPGTSIAHSVLDFCVHIGAGGLFLSTAHSIPVVDFWSKATYNNLLQFCLDNAPCTVRVLGPTPKSNSKEKGKVTQVLLDEDEEASRSTRTIAE